MTRQLFEWDASGSLRQTKTSPVSGHIGPEGRTCRDVLTLVHGILGGYVVSACEKHIVLIIHVEFRHLAAHIFYLMILFIKLTK